MNLKALYENLLSNQTPETINEASTQRVNVSPGQRILEGLSNEKAITSRRRAVKESSRITESGSTSNLDKLKNVLKDVYGSTEELEIFEFDIEVLNETAMKEIVEYVAKDEEAKIIVSSDKNLYVVDYYIYEGDIYFGISDYQDAWADGGVDPFKMAKPIGRLAKNKALQKAWQATGIGEEPDLEGIKESRSRRREVKESMSTRDLPKNSNFPHEMLDKRKNELKDETSKGKIDNYFSEEIKEAISNKRIRPRIQEGSVKFPDLSKLKNSKKPKLLKEAAGDEEEFETPQDELEKDLSSENSTDSVEEETTGFSLDDAVLIDGDLVLTISKDSGHVVNITLTDIDLDEEVLVYAKSGEENEEEEERLSESAKLRKKFLSGKH